MQKHLYNSLWSICHCLVLILIIGIDITFSIKALEFNVPIIALIAELLVMDFPIVLLYGVIYISCNNLSNQQTFYNNMVFLGFSPEKVQKYLNDHLNPSYIKFLKLRK